jgi:hypothetical protein
MTGLVVAMVAFRPPVMDDPSIVKAQAEGSSTRATTATAPPDAISTAVRRNEEMSAATRRKLDTLIDVDFNNDTALGEALHFIGTKLDVQFFLDTNSLADLNISSVTPVTLQLKQVPAEMAIDVIMRQLQTGYTVRSGVVMVFSKTALDEHVETRVYHIPQDSAFELAELIPGSLAPTTWDTVGGAASIRVFRDSLVISQTPEVHQKIEKLLKDLEPALAKGPPRPSPNDPEDSGYGRRGFGSSRGRAAPGYGGASGTYGGAR